MCTITLSCRSSIFSGKKYIIYNSSFFSDFSDFFFLSFFFFFFFILSIPGSTLLANLEKKHFLNPLFERFLGKYSRREEPERICLHCEIYILHNLSRTWIWLLWFLLKSLCIAKESPAPLDVPLKYFAHYSNPLSLPGDYQLRSVHAAKHVWVAVITNWGLMHSPPPRSGIVFQKKSF